MRLNFLTPVRFIGSALRRSVRKKACRKKLETLADNGKNGKLLSPKVAFKCIEIDIKEAGEELSSCLGAGELPEITRSEAPSELRETLPSINVSSSAHNTSRNYNTSLNTSRCRIGYRVKAPLRKSPKKSKTSLQRKMKLLAQLFPQLHQTLSMFQDVLSAAERLSSRASTFLKPLPLPFVAMFFALLAPYAEVLMVFIMILAFGSLNASSPKIFGPLCKLRSLPQISMRMCFVFQTSLSAVAVFANILSFRAGSVSAFLWTGLVVAAHVGFIRSFQILVFVTSTALILLGKRSDPLLERGLQWLSTCPGLEVYQEQEPSSGTKELDREK